MASAAYKINDRRGTNYRYYGDNNQLYAAATQTQDRKTVPNLSFDSSRNVSKLGHRQLRNIGRFIFANFGPVHGAILEQAELSVSHFIPQFVGKNKDWGEEAEAWLKDFHENKFDVRGWQFDAGAYLRSLIINARVGGEHFTILTEDETTGAPLIQVIGAHRIGSGLEACQVVGGQYDGYSLINGVIANEYGAPVAYRVYPDGNYSNNDFQDIPANNCFLLGFPEYGDEYRFVSSIASGACDWQDIKERREFELLAQKLGASIALIETNERGEPMPGVGSISRPTTAPTNPTATGLITETYDGGVVRYMKSKSGEKLESLRLDRPSSDSQAFEAEMIRGAFKGMEWDVDFSLDPSKVGGASMRVVIAKINSTIQKNQALATRAMRRIDGYALSKAQKLGWISNNPIPFDWSRWEYQGPAQVTADAKYDDDIDRERLKMGGLTYRDWYAKRGMWWEDEVRQRIKEQKFIEVESQLMGVDVNKVQMLTPNGNGNVSQNQDQVKEKE